MRYSSFGPLSLGRSRGNPSTLSFSFSHFLNRKFFFQSSDINTLPQTYRWHLFKESGTKERKRLVFCKKYSIFQICLDIFHDTAWNKLLEVHCLPTFSCCQRHCELWKHLTSQHVDKMLSNTYRIIQHKSVLPSTIDTSICLRAILSKQADYPIFRIGHRGQSNEKHRTLRSVRALSAINTRSDEMY